MHRLLLILAFIWTFAYIFLLWINIEWFSFWMDNNGLIDTKDSIINYLYAWNIDLLWSVNFTSYTSVIHYLLSYIFLNTFWFEWWYYFMYFTIISVIFYIWYRITNIFVNDQKKSLFLSLIFVFNLPFLRFFYWQWTLTFILAVIWFLLSLLFLFQLNKSKEIHTNYYLLLIIFSSLFVTHPFLFFFYFIIIFSLLYFYARVSWKKMIVFCILLWLVHFFWIFQFVIWSAVNYSLFSQNNYSDSLVNVFSANSQLYNSFIFLWKNSDYVKEFFWSFWIIIIAIYILLWWIFLNQIIRKKITRSEIVFIGLILFLLLFSVGAREPLWVFYSYLYNNISLFSVFRTFSNVLLFCFYLLSLFIIIHWNKLTYKIIISTNLIFISLFICSIYFNTYNKTTTIPQEYFDIKTIVDDWEQWKNVLLLPCSTYDYYKWDNGTQDKYFLESFFNNSWIVFYRLTLSNNYILKNLFDDICSYKIDQDELTKYWIKYIFLRKDLIHLEQWYYQKFDENKFNNLEWVHKIYSWNYVSLYEINNELPNDFRYESPVKYSWNFFIKESKNIYFLNDYNPNWKLYLKNQEWLFSTPLFDSTHHLVYDYANAWTLSKNEIIAYVNENYSQELQKEGYPKKLSDGRFDYKYYTLYPNGSIDAELTLYFKPQSYFYLGIIISWTTFIFLVWYLFIDGLRIRRKEYMETNKTNIEAQ